MREHHNRQDAVSSLDVATSKHQEIPRTKTRETEKLTQSPLQQTTRRFFVKHASLEIQRMDIFKLKKKEWCRQSAT